MPTVYLLISGKVQGVFYRASAREKAESLGISGWVRNTEAGDVEAMATGTHERLEQWISWCRQGPPRAVVSDVVITTMPEEIFEGFKVKRN